MTAVYVMQSGDGPVKIGIANDPDRRRREVGAGQPFPVAVVHRVSLGADARAVERIAHRLLAEKRLRGEWFDVGVQEAVAAIEAAIAEIADRPSLDDGDDGNTLHFHMRISAEILAALDEIRRREPDLPSRAKMLRRLIMKYANGR